MRSTHALRFRCVCLVTAAALLAQSYAFAATDRITLSGQGIAPESLTSTADGTVIISSAARQIFRAAPGQPVAEKWIDAPEDGPRSIFGVLADERSNTLWACSGSVPATTSELYAFGLRSGKLMARYPLPTEKGICNDIAVAVDGTVYATDSTNMQVVRLVKGKQQLDIWAGSDGDAFGPSNGILDGIAVIGNRVVVNTLVTSKLFSVPVLPKGNAGDIAEITLDRALDGPDGMRSLGTNRILVVETGSDGTLARIHLNDNKGRVDTVRKSFKQGAVAVTIVDKRAYVLGSRPRTEDGADGSSPRFEAIVVPLTSNP